MRLLASSLSMKILQLGKFWPVKGGVEKVMFDLTRGLGSRGIECDMMCGDTEGAGRVITAAPNARVLTTHTWLKAAATTIAPSMVYGLRKIAPAYDIIHIHHPDPMAALALRMSGYKGKVVLHWHSDIVKQKQLLRFYEPLQKWLLHRADAVVGTSPDYISHSPALDAVRDKTSCIPIGIYPLSPDPQDTAGIRAAYPGKKIIFFLGRLIPYKGLEYLVAAAAHLPEDYIVVIGGTGPLLADLRQQAQALGLHDKVIFLGEVPEERKAAWFDACHLFCLPSVMKTEAFGIVQIEAMSLGRPVVATRIEGSGTAWVNSHGVSGLNVAVRDARALAQAFTSVLSDPATYAAYCRGAIDRFHTIFHIDSMIDNTLHLYTSLI